MELAQKILSDYWLIAIAVNMLAGAGGYSIFNAWVNRNNPDLKSLAESLNKMAEAVSSKQERENSLLQKLVDNAIEKNKNV